VRLAPERAQMYGERLSALIDEFLAEQPEPGGQVYALLGAFFLAPPYIQGLEAEAQGVAGDHGAGDHEVGERDDERAHTG
jgi:hypothetical protein